MKKLFIVTFIAASLVLLAACSSTPAKDGQYASIARCLTEKGVKFYGAFWCPHCQNQKKMFGDDIRYIDYIECDPKGENSKTEECLKVGVKQYPSWFFPGQGMVTGEKKPEELAKKANCDVPADAASATQTETQVVDTVSASAAETTTITQTTK